MPLVIQYRLITCDVSGADRSRRPVAARQQGARWYPSLSRAAQSRLACRTQCHAAGLDARAAAQPLRLHFKHRIAQLAIDPGAHRFRVGRRQRNHPVAGVPLVERLCVLRPPIQTMHVRWLQVRSM